MKDKYNIIGLWMPAKTGGLIFCKNCNKIVGSVNIAGYKYLNIGLFCTCGSYGSIEIARKNSTSDLNVKINKMPHFKNNLASCKRCKTPIFGIIENRVSNYSFYAECICGEKYDTRPVEQKRLGETLMLLKNMNKRAVEK